MKLLIPALALLSTTAMAADLKWNMEGRFDYGNSTVKHETNVSTNNYKEKRSEFYSGIIRLNAAATITENLSARFRYRLSSEQSAATQQRDLTFGNVDYFYVDHKSQWFTARIGKSNQVESVGREYFVSGTDYNVTAYKFGSSGAAGTTGYSPMNTAVYNQVNTDAGLYHVGLSLINNTALEGQTFTISAFNPEKKTAYTDTAGAANDSKSSKMGLGAYYNGKFLDGLVQPTLGYTNFGITSETGNPTTANNGPDSINNKLMAAGIRSEFAGFVVDADWKQYKRDNAALTGATSTADKTTSYYANVAYAWDMFVPFVNYIHDKYDRTADNTATVGDYKRDALSVGVQIRPYKDNNFRYHVAYTSDVRKNELATGATADTKVKANMIVAGIKFDL
ncbi:MAG: hypothetical protein H7177_15680 [Rhizobacter sp.]|nr:hypothetical protein [Bacteriovorax sp.]